VSGELETHERRPRASGHFFDPCDAVGEQWARRHRVAIGDAAASGTSAEFDAKEHVADAGGVQPIL
jgi:hypothetical protein